MTPDFFSEINHGESMKKLLMALMLCSAALAQAEDKVKATGKSVDVMKFDISGVRLGMSQEEALKILKEKFPNASKEDERKSGEDLSKLHGKSFVYIAMFNMGDGETIGIQFEPNVLENKPQELVVAGVFYSLDEGDYDTNVKRMQKDAVKKFGAPVAIDMFGGYEWCDLSGKPLCEKDKPILSLKKKDPLGKKNSAENPTALILFSPPLQKAASEAAEKNAVNSSKKLKL
jgi:hypothetical protein